MKKVNILYYIIIFAIIGGMALYFPLTRTDVSWLLKDIRNLYSIISIRDTSIITSVLTSTFLNYKLVRVVMTGLICIGIISLIKNIINKKNAVLSLIALSIFLLLDKETLLFSLIDTKNLNDFFVGSLGLLLLMNIYIKNSIPKMNCFVLLILGFLFSNLNMPISLTIFLITNIHILKREDTEEVRSHFLLAGETAGLIYNIVRMQIEYKGLSYMLLHEFIPSVCESNFIIVLIFSALVLICAIKVFTQGNEHRSFLAILGVSSFLFSSLLSTSYYINYMTYIIYTLSCIYILYNLSNSRIFKRKISIYYLFKVIYILFICSLGNIDLGSTLFIYLIDIILIVEIYDHVLPTDFLSPLWIVVTLLFGVANIYIYKDTYRKSEEMHFFIKNKLECTNEPVVLPSKYENLFLLNSLPIDEETTREYIDFYGVNLYIKERDIIIEFRNSFKLN